MLRRLRAAALILALMFSPLAAPPTAWAAEEETSPGEMAAEGLEKMMRAIELFVGSIPLYAPPELLPNGDIIIRRIDPEEPDSAPPRGEGENGDETGDETGDGVTDI